jgi:hypothetical protein
MFAIPNGLPRNQNSNYIEKKKKTRGTFEVEDASRLLLLLS